MDKEEKKIKLLLKYYYKNSIPITFSLQDISHQPIRGKIIKKSIFGMGYVVIKQEKKSNLKVFVEEIVKGSILPLDYEEMKGGNY